MKSPARLCIGGDFPASLHLAREFEIVLNVVPEIVRIDEVLAGIVRRVDVDELYLCRRSSSGGA